MLKHRLLFGSLMIVGLAGLLWLDSYLGALVLPLQIDGKPIVLPPGLLIALLVLCLMLLAARELVAMCRAKGFDASTRVIATGAGSLLILLYLLPLLSTKLMVAMLGTAMVIAFAFAMLKANWRKKRTEGSIAAAGVALLGVLYLGVLPGFFVAIRHEYSAWVLAAIFAVIKCSDIGAYFTGRAFGKHKLIYWLSPGKTWEGFAGGLLLSGIVAVAFAAVSNNLGYSGHWRMDGSEMVFVEQLVPLPWAFFLGGLFGAIGQFGDLTESMIKRDAGVKDSGQSIPGFGGVLDVVDSPLMVAPIAYWALMV